MKPTYTRWKNHTFPGNRNPQRPWWTATGDWEYTRDDGAVLFLFVHSEGGRWELAGPEAQPVWLDCKFSRYTWPPAMAEADRDYPIPPPPPACGQVWQDEGRDRLVFDVEVLGSTPETLDDYPEPNLWRVAMGTDGAKVYSTENDGHPPWPPQGMVLVAGTGAPWAPMRAPL